jgi:hypothetical protein
MLQESQPVVKQPYTEPQLVVYGDIRLLTQQGTKSGAGDNSGTKANGKSGG